MPELTTGARTLSTLEFDVVWEAFGLGPTPVVLNIPSPGRTHTERRRLAADAWTALHHRGLVGAAGPEPGLRRLLRRLAAPAARIELRAWGSAPTRAVAAGDAVEGVLASRRGDTVTVEACSSLPDAIVRVLPRTPAGPGQSIIVPTAAPAPRVFRRIDGRAQLGVVVADQSGVMRRSPAVLGTLDCPTGRYLVTHDRGWTTITPADARRLHHRVGELLTQAVDRPDQSRSPWRMSCRPVSVIEPDSDG